MAKLKRKIMKKSPSKKQVVKKPEAKKTAQRAKPIAQAKARPSKKK
jgi:hypothetical protein